MKKKIITALLAAIIAVSFASCGIVRGTPAETSGAVKSKDTSLLVFYKTAPCVNVRFHPLG